MKHVLIIARRAQAQL